MNRMIGKYVLDGRDAIEMPEGAQVLTAQWQDHSGVCVWATIDTDAPTRERRFVVVGTGLPLPDGVLTYVATVQSHTFVWHVFEVDA